MQLPIRAFEDIVRDFKDPVYNVCLGMMKSADDAEDLAQEVFITAYKNLGKFKGESKVSTWLYRIAANKCLEAQRRKQRQKRGGQSIPLNEAPETGSDQFYHPGVEMENRERSAILFTAIDQLPDSQRVAFTLQQVEGLSLIEIGSVMEKTTSSIESLLHRAKTNLRKILRSYYEEHG